MKRLFVIRHAKSDWSDAALTDKQRTLNARGLREAPIMAAALVKDYPQIDHIISSSAVRTQQTAQHVADAYGISHDQIQLCDEIYEAPYEQLLKVVNTCSNEHSAIILVGHMPGVTLLVNSLADENLSMSPTSSVTVIDFPYITSWEEVSQGTGTLKEFRVV
ncbi:MAG: histidine phosphatase family protein [Ignavibacteria bacterium]|nr:histidine phosphatase family protein [Ignavibacteria bacterium]